MVHLLIMAVAVVISLPFMPYDWHVFLHVVGGLLFMGGVGSNLWLMIAGHVGNDREFAAHASRTGRWVDLHVVAPGILLVLINGMTITVERWGGWTGFHDFRWLETSLALFVAVALVWAVVTRRDQAFLARAAALGADADGDVAAAVRRRVRRLYVGNAVIVVITLAILYIMVSKPWG